MSWNQPNTPEQIEGLKNAAETIKDSLYRVVFDLYDRLPPDVQAPIGDDARADYTSILMYLDGGNARKFVSVDKSEHLSKAVTWIEDGGPKDWPNLQNDLESYVCWRDTLTRFSKPLSFLFNALGKDEYASSPKEME